MVKFNAKKEAAKINKMKIKGVTASTFTPGRFTQKQKESIKKAREHVAPIKL